jgi:enoyl-CoA hydratase
MLVGPTSTNHHEKEHQMTESRAEHPASLLKSRKSNVVVERDGLIGTIKLRPLIEAARDGAGDPDYLEHHISVALAVEDLRRDDTVRVIVITGEQDGEFHAAPPMDLLASQPRTPSNHRQGIHYGVGAVRGPWSLSLGIERLFEALSLCEKPVIAKVNGDAIAFGQSILWGCDIIVAREDAVIADSHLGMGETTDHRGDRRGPSFGMAPGDGALSFLPLFMTPAKMKEFLFLGKPYTARELADANIINYAVPLTELDGKVDELAAALLRRPARTLARVKRVANKNLVQQWNLTGDLSKAYEWLDLWELTESDSNQDFTFRPDDPAWGVQGYGAPPKES